jgi:hypothetical protein
VIAFPGGQRARRRVLRTTKAEIRAQNSSGSTVPLPTNTTRAPFANALA